jgi:hypothetical protein
MPAYTPRSTSSFNPYSAGDKVYGGGRSFPTSGPVDKTGYKERDLVSKSRRDAILRRLKATQSGDYASSDAMRKV